MASLDESWPRYDTHNEKARWVKPAMLSVRQCVTLFQVAVTSALVLKDRDWRCQRMLEYIREPANVTKHQPLAACAHSVGVLNQNLQQMLLWETETVCVCVCFCLHVTSWLRPNPCDAGFYVQLSELSESLKNIFCC